MIFSLIKLSQVVNMRKLNPEVESQMYFNHSYNASAQPGSQEQLQEQMIETNKKEDSEGEDEEESLPSSA